MYTGDTTSTASKGNTKSTIQALLKSKEQCSVSARSLSGDSSKDKGFSSNYSVASDSDLGSIPQNLEFDFKSSPNANSQESLEYQKDFNYSQKLFHIADGNLYSIFSPIQGRSYGMKPSFLRKQKYTVQECHNRGRKSLRKGLKFHNFLPSESVTSEKDNGYLNAKWKVHSECRLREEHGTKQITISNWSQSVQNPPSETANVGVEATVSSPLPDVKTNYVELSPQSKCEDQEMSDCKHNINDPYDFNLNLQSLTSENKNMHLKLRIKSGVIQNSSTCTSSCKKDSLSFVVNSLMEKPQISEKRSNCSEELDIHNKSCQKHRRKPVQTRRVVPYVKYLSIMEENESLPLDLSSKCLIENSSSPTLLSCDDSRNISGKSNLDFSKSSFAVCDTNTKIDNSNYVVSNDNLPMPNISGDKLLINAPLDGTMHTRITTPVTVLYPLPFNKTSNLGQNRLHSASLQGTSNSKMRINMKSNVNNTPPASGDRSYSLINHSPSSNTFSVQKSFVKEVQSKPRKRNQKSVIKQKLEDTFRQNGFLVKTKQVSDGEATFCKFRQLRKYTRYYLKSLEQHLPDEFHKMWKGFLPPKTVLPPPVLEMSDPANDGVS